MSISDVTPTLSSTEEGEERVTDRLVQHYYEDLSRQKDLL